jgi:hypothetical protein
MLIEPGTGPLAFTFQASTPVASLCFEPRSNLLRIISDRMLGWGNLVQGGIEIYDTPGHHADLVRDPRVRVLAQQLDDALAKAQARFERPVMRAKTGVS